MSQPFDRLLDARGLNCPVPLINARKEIGKLEPFQVLKVVATDRDSVADFQSWAKVARYVELVGQETEPMDGSSVYAHYVKRVA